MKLSKTGLLKTLFCLSLIILPLSVIHADSAAKDYSGGLEKFSKFGLPDVSDAVYVKLSPVPFNTGMLPWKYPTRGNAWLLKEITDSKGDPVKGIFVINGTREVEIKNLKFMTSPPKSSSENNEIHAANWKKANLDLEIKNVMRCLKKLRKGGFIEIYLDDRIRSRLFIFALHLFQKGRKKEANELLSMLFSLENDKRILILRGLNLLADSQYKTIYDQFLHSKNWQAYLEGIRKLSAKYGTAWKHKNDITKLTEQIERKIKKNVSVPNAVKQWNPEDRQLFAELASIKKIHISPPYETYSAPIWLLSATWKDKCKDIDHNIDLKIRSKGIEAIPFLLEAMQDNKTLTELDLSSIKKGDPYDYSQKKPFYTRPATRGKVAEKILREIISQIAKSDEIQNSDDLAEFALDFYKKHKDKNSDAIALLFLESGSHAKQALDILLHHTATRNIPGLTEFLSGESSSSWVFQPDKYSSYETSKIALLSSTLIRYIAIKGNSAVPLTDKLAANIKVWADKYKKPSNVSYGSEEENKKYEQDTKNEIRGYAKRLKAVPYNKSAEEILKSLKEGVSLPEELELFLVSKLSALPPDKEIELVLKQALREDNEAIRDILNKAGERKGVTPTANAELWKKLFNKHSPSISEKPVCDFYLITYEKIFFPPEKNDNDSPFEENTPAERLLCYFPKKGRELLKKRAILHLNGGTLKDLAKVPLKKELTKKEIAALKEKLSESLQKKDLPSLADKLNIYELCALSKILLKSPELNKKIFAETNLITDIDIQTSDAEWKKRFDSWKGKQPSQKLIKAMQQFCREKAEKGQERECLLKRKDLFDGLELKAFDCVQAKKRKTDNRKTTVVGFSGSIFAVGIYSIVAWRTTPLPKEITWETVISSEKSVIDDFWKQAEKFCTDIPDASSPGLIRFKTVKE